MVSKKQIKANKQNSLKHGGAAAEKSIATGAAFTGPAREAELAVQNELETVGRLSIVERNAVRLQAAANLYWGALVDAAEKGDEEKYNSYLKTFGWLVGKAGKAWELHRTEKDLLPTGLDYELILHSEKDSQ